MQLDHSAAEDISIPSPFIPCDHPVANEADAEDAPPTVEASSSETELSDSEYDSDLERLRIAIDARMRVGDVPVPRYSNSAFTREGIRNISISAQDYDDTAPTNQPPTAEVILEGTQYCQSPSLYYNAQYDRLGVDFHSWNVRCSSPHPRSIAFELVQRMIEVFVRLFVQCRNYLALAMSMGIAYDNFRQALRITANWWMLDTGSEVHIATSENQQGIYNIVDTHVNVDGIGTRSVCFRRQGNLADIGLIYIGNAPCNIVSAGRAIANGSRLSVHPNLDLITLTTPNGTIFRFRRRGMVWICRRPLFAATNDRPLPSLKDDSDDDDNNVGVSGHSNTVVRNSSSTSVSVSSSSKTSSTSSSSNKESSKSSSSSTLSMVTTIEQLKRQFTKKQLEEIERVKSLHESLDLPGKATLLATVNSGEIMNIPNVSTEGIHNYFKLYGKPAAEDAGDRVKFKPKIPPQLVDESILEHIRKVILSIDLFFIGKLAFMIGSFMLPWCERPLILQQYLAKGKKPEAIVDAIRAFIGTMKTHRVEATLIRCDQEPALVASKSLIESTLGIKVEQLTENVPPAERSIRSVKTGCRKRVALLAFKLFPTLIPFLVAWAVSRLNLLVSATVPGKLTPYHAFTGRKPNYQHLAAASFGQIVRCDSTNSEFPNTLEPRSVDAIALVPTGNQHGDWFCYNLSTCSIIRRYIRRNDPVPTTQTHIDLINSLAATHSQDMMFTTFSGEVLDEVHGHDTLSSHGRSAAADDEVVLDLHSEEKSSYSSSSSSNIQPSTIQSASEELQPSDDGGTNTGVPIPGVPIPGVDSLIGKKVYKRFTGYGDQAFEGTVTSFKAPWYKITYVDGDEEEMTAKEIHRHSKVPPRSFSAFTKLGKQFAFHMSLKKGMTKHGDAALSAIRKELTSIHKTGTLQGVDYSRLSPAIRSKAIRSMLLFKEKYYPNGEFEKLKARVVAGGDQQDRELYSTSQTSSPTVATEVLMMVATIAAHEKRHVVTADVTSAFLRGKFDKDATPVIMRLDKELADVLVDIEPSYRKFQRDNGSVYCRLMRPLYGLVEAAKLWHDEITRTLLEEGFTQNPYDQCTYNRMYRGKQHTIVLHVDDMFCTCEDPRANKQIIKALEAKYDKIGVQEGLVHSYLGMTFDFSESGKVKVTQDGYVSELLASEDIRSAVKTPATDALFDIEEVSELLSKSDKEHFHSIVAKLLYLSKRTRPDIMVAVNFLTSRVLVATQQDREKLYRVLKYLYGTQKWGIVLESDDNLLLLRVFIDASYGVHSDGKSHTGLVLMMGKGVIICKSVKQKINTKSSTEAELVALSDSISMAIWCRNFLEAQGYKMPPASVFQDNQSTIAMVRAGKPTSDRTRHVNIRFFFVADREKSGEIAISYMPTKDMLADVLTKPLQGELFLKLRKELLNWEED